MRPLCIGASLFALATSNAFAAPKKKPAKPAPKTNSTGAGVNPSDIELGPPATPPSGDSPTSEAPSPTAATPTSALPLAINDRTLTLGKHRIDVHAALPIGIVTVPDITGNNTSSTIVSFALGATYGVNDKAEVGADYAIGLHPGDIKGPLTLHGAYLAIDKPDFDLAVSAAFVVHPIGYTDPASGMDSTTTYVAVQAGAWFRYRVTPKLTAFTGLPALPHPAVSLARTGFAFPPQPYQLSLGLNNSGAVALSLPVGIGFQATPNIYAFAATNLANIKLSHTSNAVLFKDFIPLTIGGFYALNKFDLGAVFSDDLRQAADYLSFSVVARYFIR